MFRSSRRVLTTARTALSTSSTQLLHQPSQNITRRLLSTNVKPPYKPSAAIKMVIADKSKEIYFQSAVEILSKDFDDSYAAVALANLTTALGKKFDEPNFKNILELCDDHTLEITGTHIEALLLNPLLNKHIYDFLNEALALNLTKIQKQKLFERVIFNAKNLDALESLNTWLRNNKLDTSENRYAITQLAPHAQAAAEILKLTQFPELAEKDNKELQQNFLSLLIANVDLLPEISKWVVETHEGIENLSLTHLKRVIACFNAPHHFIDIDNKTFDKKIAEAKAILLKAGLGTAHSYEILALCEKENLYSVTATLNRLQNANMLTEQTLATVMHHQSQLFRFKFLTQDPFTAEDFVRLGRRADIGKVFTIVDALACNPGNQSCIRKIFNDLTDDHTSAEFVAKIAAQVGYSHSITLTEYGQFAIKAHEEISRQKFPEKESAVGDIVYMETDFGGTSFQAPDLVDPDLTIRALAKAYGETAGGLAALDAEKYLLAQRSLFAESSKTSHQAAQTNTETQSNDEGNYENRFLNGFGPGC